MKTDKNILILEPNDFKAMDEGKQLYAELKRIAPFDFDGWVERFHPDTKVIVK